MSGFSSPAAAKMSITPSGATAREMIWRTAWSSSSSERAVVAARFTRTDCTAWKNPTSSRMRIASSCGTASANARDRSRAAWMQRSLPFSCARMCSCAAGSRLSRSCGVPVIHAERSKPWNRAQQISYFSSITATASP